MVIVSLNYSYGQSNPDSTKIALLVENFFNWYVQVIKNNESEEYLPQFVSDKNGKTTLDYSIYMNNLKKLSFSNSLINTEKESYQICIENLSKVNYSELDSIYDELDDYELSNCDFFNYYRWTGGMEPIDGVKINKVKIVNDTADVVIKYFNCNPKDSTYYYWNNETSVILIKQNGEWKINEFK